MNQKLEKLVDSNIDHFDEWIQNINDYNSSLRYDSKYSDDENIDLTYKVAEALGRISEIFFKYGAFKDTFDNSKIYVHLYGPEVIINSEKTGNVFYLGLDNKGIYLNTCLRYAENIRHMDDKFYQNIFTLMDLGDFDIEQNQYYGVESDEKYKYLYANNKSKVYKFLRNYLVGVIEGEREIAPGDFCIRWNYQTNFYDIVYNGCLAFKILYGMNYQLWKTNDTKLKKAKKKLIVE